MSITHVSKIKIKKGDRVLVRVDFNVPIKNGKVADSFRINESKKTIDFLVSKGARIILISHIGKDGKESLKPVASFLKKEYEIFFSEEILGKKVEEKISEMEPGEIMLLENIRKEPGEMENAKLFAIELSRLADIYVNDAFSVSHRAHASIVSLPKILPSCIGFRFDAEVVELSKVLSKPASPFLFILGGKKFETKMPLITKFLNTADEVFIGGALANNFLKEEGHKIGKSLIDEQAPDLSPLIKNPKLLLPVDIKVAKNDTTHVVGLDEVSRSEVIVDIGPKTIDMLAPYIKKAKMILWNGPLGKDEHIEGTKALLDLIAAHKKAIRIIGGGDTVEIISKYDMHNEVGFVSTGGGATLYFLSTGTLPGLEALDKE